MKSTRLYLGGRGYAGITCQHAEVEPGKVYTDYATACIDAGKLGHHNPVGFVVTEYKDENLLPRDE